MTGKTTHIWRVDAERPDKSVIERCARILNSGGLVAFPTETVYGLGADALHGRAVRGIFAAKGRPSDNPLIVHVADAEDAFALARDVPTSAWELAERFWPGPLTLIVHKRDGIPRETTAGLQTIGVRVPAHPVALALLRATRRPIAAPSANASGKPSPTLARHVADDLSGKIDAIIDGGSTDIGLESTVVDMTADRPVILRPGGITEHHMRVIVPDVVHYRRSTQGRNDEFVSLRQDDTLRPRSPGIKYKHYAPDTPARLMSGSPEVIAESIERLERFEPNMTRGYIVSTETRRALHKRMTTENDGVDDRMIVIGSRDDPETIARRLYDCLRTLDQRNIDEMMIEAFDAGGIGGALADRLMRATSSE